MPTPPRWLGPSFLDLWRRRQQETHGQQETQGDDDASAARGATHIEPLDPMHGTTVLAVRYDDGVVMAADRRAVSGTRIAMHHADKLFPADRTSGIAISGVPGPALEIVKLLQTEFEHYEKLQGTELSLDGKVNRLSALLRGHLPAAMVGLVVVPIFAGYDARAGTCRLFSFDPTGGRYEERMHCAAGSGAIAASTTVTVGLDATLDRVGALALALEALRQAADIDTFTGGVDELRGVYPSVAVIDATGYHDLSDSEVAESIEPRG